MLGRRVGLDLAIPAQTLACTVIGASLFGLGTIMADPQVTAGSVEHPGGQPLEPVTEGLPSLLTVPKEELPMPEGVGAPPVLPEAPPIVPQVSAAPDQVTPPLRLPESKGMEAAGGEGAEDQLIPLDSASLDASGAGNASLTQAGAAADGTAATLDMAGLQGSREVSRDILDELQTRNGERPWTFSLRGGVVYDDNVGFQQNGGDQSSDIIINTGFNSTYTLPGGNLIRSFNAVAGGSYMTYTENSEFSGWNANVGLATSYAIGSLSGALNLRADQMNAADRLVGGFSVSRNYLAGLTGNYDVSDKTRLTASLDMVVIDFLQQGYQEEAYNGNSTLRATVGANYAVTTKTRLGASYMWSSAKREDESAWGFSSLNATAEWTATAKTRISGSIGRQVSSLDGVETGDGPGWVGSLTGSWQATDRMALTIGFTRSTAAAAVGGNGGMTFNTVSAGLSRTLTDRLTASVRMSFRSDTYEDLDGGSEFEGREATFWNVDSTLTWRMTSRAALLANYQFMDNSSNLSSWNFRANRFGINFMYSF